MVLDLGVSSIPTPVFVVVHLTALAVGIALAAKSFGAGERGRIFGYAFSLFALAEILYLGYHLTFTTFLLSHTLAEVLDLVAFILAFVGASQVAFERRAVAQPVRA